MTNETMKVTEGRTYIEVAHGNETRRFVAPYQGPANFRTVRDSIRAAGDVEPTMYETLSLNHAASQNRKNKDGSVRKYSDQVLDVLRNRWHWAFNGILYVPGEGAFINDRPEMDNQGVVVEQSKARFVPFGYRTGADNDVEHNAFVIGLAGEEGAGLVAKLARDLKLTPYVWALTAGDVTTPQKRVAALDSSGDGLLVYGNGFDYDANGCAFGYAPEGRQ